MYVVGLSGKLSKLTVSFLKAWWQSLDHPRCTDLLHYSEKSQPAPCGWTLEADVRLTVSPPHPTLLPPSFPPSFLSTIATSISAQTPILPRLHSKRPWLLPSTFPYFFLILFHCIVCVTWQVWLSTTRNILSPIIPLHTVGLHRWLLCKV